MMLKPKIYTDEEGDEFASLVFTDRAGNKIEFKTFIDLTDHEVLLPTWHEEEIDDYEIPILHRQN